MALNPKAERTLHAWHRMVAASDLSEVPRCARPTRCSARRWPTRRTGAPLVAQFLQQAVQVFEEFRYHRTFIAGDRSVVLEFSAKVGGKELKGIDMVRFDEDGRMVDFEVMVRPASGLQALGAEMTRRMTPILAAAKEG